MATIEEMVEKAVQAAVKRSKVNSDQALTDAKTYTQNNFVANSAFVGKIVDWLVNTVKCVHATTYPSNGTRTDTFTAVVGKRYLMRQWLSDYAGTTQSGQSSSFSVTSGATTLLTLANYHTHRMMIVKATSTTVTYTSLNAQSNWHQPANVEVYQLD